MLDDVVALPTPFGVIQIRVARRDDPTPTPEQQRAARRAALELQFALESFDRQALAAAAHLHGLLLDTQPPGPRRVDASLATRRRLDGMAQELVAAFERGRLVVHQGALLQPARAEEELGARRPQADPAPPPAPPPRALASEEFFAFEARFVDEINQGIGGVDVEFDVGGKPEPTTTNPAGVARLDGVKATSASIRAVDLAALERILDPRWDKPRSGSAPSGVNQRDVAFDGSDFGGTSLKPELAHTIVLKPPLGVIFMELYDTTGRERLIERPYAISGPMSFSGKTDAAGRLRHEEVFPGDYELTLTLTVETAAGERTDEYQTRALVLDRQAAAPQVRLLGAMPRVNLVRLRGLLFDLNKAFLLPSALPGLKLVRELYVENNPSELLIVGHTDTSGEIAFNDQLSLERAEAMQAYLEDDVERWLAFYETSVPARMRWGSVEDLHMIAALPDFTGQPTAAAAIRWFQRGRGLEVDGVAGPKTRRQLIGEYMALDGASLADAALDIRVTTHGCGEHFPVDDSGDELDPAAADATRDPGDRRVELFFFDPELGIDPPPPGKSSAQGSTQYPDWRRRARLTELSTTGKPLEVELVDPDGAPLSDVPVRATQDDRVVFEGRTNTAGQVIIRGHDPTRNIAIFVEGKACMVIEGRVADEQAEELAALDPGTPSGGEPGCRIEDADTLIAALEPSPDSVFV